MDITTRDQAMELLDTCNAQISKCERGMAVAIVFGLNESLIKLLNRRIELAGQKGKLEYMLTIL